MNHFWWFAAGALVVVFAGVVVFLYCHGAKFAAESETWRRH